MDEEEKWLTPLQSTDKANTFRRSQKTKRSTEKEKEAHKRNRDNYETDSESQLSDVILIGSTALKKKKGEDKSISSASKLNQSKEESKRKEKDKEKEKEREKEEEEDVLKLIGELSTLLKKTRASTKEVKSYCMDPTTEVRSLTKTHAAQADRQLEAAITRLKNIELIIENKNLKNSLLHRDVGIQCSINSRYVKRRTISTGAEQSEAEGSRRILTYESETEGLSETVETEAKHENEWKRVENKKKKEERKAMKKKNKEEAADLEKRTQEREKEKERERIIKQKIPPPPKSEAIIIKTTEKRSFADLFKQLKANPGENMNGIHTVRKSRGGDIVIEMEKGKNAGLLEKFAKETLGEECLIRRMAPKVIYEIKDLDPTIEKEELQEELAHRLQRQKEEIQIKTIRYGYGGTKTAIVSVSSEVLEILGQENKLRIGFTNCRVKRTQNILRCFKCHAFGHLSYNCTLDLKGKELCRRCGGLGHQINGCDAIRCCILCTREGIHSSKAEHVAGAANCPQYKKYIEKVEKGLVNN